MEHHNLIAIIKAIFPYMKADLITISPLSGGYSGVSNYLIHYQNSRFVLRNLSSYSQKAFKKELFLSTLAGAHRLGPKIYSNDTFDKPFFAMDFVPGAHLSQTNLASSEPLFTHLAKFKKVQIQEFPKKQSIVTKTLEFYDKAQVDISDYYQWLTRYEKLQSEKSRDCFCHNDLNPKNIIVGQNQSITIIDWTDAGLGWQLEDIAYLCVFLDVLGISYKSYEKGLSQEDSLHFLLLRYVCLLRHAFWAIARLKERNIPFVRKRHVLNLHDAITHSLKEVNYFNKTEQLLVFSNSALDCFDRNKARIMSASQTLQDMSV